MTTIVSFTVTCQINAKKWIQLHGALKKSDPNSVRNNRSTGRKRKLEETSGAGMQSASSEHQGTCYVCTGDIQTGSLKLRAAWNI